MRAADSIRLSLGGLLRQRRLAPIGAGALHAPRRQVEPGGLEQLHTERVHEGARVLPATASISQAPVCFVK